MIIASITGSVRSFTKYKLSFNYDLYMVSIQNISKSKKDY